MTTTPNPTTERPTIELSRDNVGEKSRACDCDLCDRYRCIENDYGNETAFGEDDF